MYFCGLSFVISAFLYFSKFLAYFATFKGILYLESCEVLLKTPEAVRAGEKSGKREACPPNVYGFQNHKKIFHKCSSTKENIIETNFDFTNKWFAVLEINISKSADFIVDSKFLF